MRHVCAVLVVWCLIVPAAAAQDDIIAQARAASRVSGIAMLQKHLVTSPDDVDARLVLGLLLSWEGRYDEARDSLQQVLAQAPTYLDAQVALMNVELWSGHSPAARLLVNQILRRDPGQPQARLALQRLDARTRPWSAGVSYARDTFSDDREPWQETAITLGRETPVGSLVVRGTEAHRFGLSDQQGEIEFYPTFRAGSYAFIGVGWSRDQVLFPEHRVSVDLYQGLGHGVEISGGYRRLQFSSKTDIYLATLTKYSGNWMLTGKVFHVPDKVTGASWSYHGQARRYFGAEGTSFIGFGYSHGFSKEEPRGSGDLIRVGADTIRGQAQVDATPTMRFSISASTGRQERALRDALWQTTLGGGLTLRF